MPGDAQELAKVRLSDCSLGSWEGDDGDALLQQQGQPQETHQQPAGASNFKVRLSDCSLSSWEGEDGGELMLQERHQQPAGAGNFKVPLRLVGCVVLAFVLVGFAAVQWWLFVMLQQLASQVEALPGKMAGQCQGSSDVGNGSAVEQDANAFKNMVQEALWDWILQGFLTIVGFVIFSAVLYFVPAQYRHLVGGEKAGHTTQEEMMKIFMPKIVQNGKPLIKKRTGIFARRAKKGELVRTIIFGEETMCVQAKDDDSMVIRDNTFSHELRLIPRHKFDQLYGCETDIDDNDPSALLKAAGFKTYTPKGKVYVYEVTQQDVALLPTEHFETSFGKVQRLKAGGYLATGFPESNAKDIYVFHGHKMYDDLKVWDTEQIKNFFETQLRSLQGHWEIKGCIMARQTKRKGEPVCTYQHSRGCEVHTKTTDETDMIVRSNTVDAEHRIWKKQDFEEEFERHPTHPIEGDAKRAGYLAYQYKRKVGMYEVMKSDLPQDVPEMWMRGRHGDMQQIQPGDRLAVSNGDVFIVKAQDMAQYGC